jgi:site-specific DNA recombinase
MADSQKTTAPVQRVAIYCRVSTDKQASKEDSSLDTQRDRLIRYVEDKQRAGQNWQLTDTFVEGEDKDGKRRGCSGKNLDRPGFSQLMEKVRGHLVDVVVFTKMDRISRNVIDFLTLVEEFERHEVRLVSLKEEINTASASGRVMTTIMIALAQFEREQISERTCEKMAWRAAKGLPVGPPPLGYEMHEKRYRSLPKEVDIVRFLDQAYLETRSLDQVARMAHQRGFRTRKGHTLTKNAISCILKNPAYIGKISFNGETFQASHEPIRDEKTYARILQSLERNWLHKGNGRSKAKLYEYLLQGLMLCGYCKGKMVPRTSMGRGGRPYHYYICNRADKTSGIDCPKNYLDAIEADHYVLNYVKQLALRDDLVLKLCQEQDVSFAESLRALRRDQERIKERLAENQREAANLVRAMARMGEDPPRAMLQVSQELDHEKAELEATLSRMGEEASKLEQTSMRVELAGKTVRYLAQILSHDRVTPDLLKDCLPKFINYVIWRKDVKQPTGRVEIALFERPFRGDQGRLLREIVEDLEGGRNGTNGASGS